MELEMLGEWRGCTQLQIHGNVFLCKKCWQILMEDNTVMVYQRKVVSSAQCKSNLHRIIESWNLWLQLSIGSHESRIWHRGDALKLVPRWAQGFRQPSAKDFTGAWHRLNLTSLIQMKSWFLEVLSTPVLQVQADILTDRYVMSPKPSMCLRCLTSLTQPGAPVFHFPGCCPRISLPSPQPS